MRIREDLVKIVGENNVLDDLEILKDYSKDHSFATPKMPELVVKPKKRHEIQKIIHLANKMDFKIIPVSSKGPRFHGDTIPTKDNTVILDLSNMKNIEWIQRKNRVCVVEPGVTFGELQEELKKQGLRIAQPLCPRSTKSVISVHWERVPNTLPKYHWDAADPLASTEVMLGSGDILWGGEVGFCGNDEKWQRKQGFSHKVPFGVFSFNIRKVGSASQGTLCACTWASLRCELLPEREELYFAHSNNLSELTTYAHQLVYDRTVDDVFILNSLSLASLLRKDPKKIRELANELLPWTLIYTVSGFSVRPEEMINYKKNVIKERKIPMLDSISGINANEIMTKVIRKPSEEPYWKIRVKGDMRDLFFLTSLKKSAFFVDLVEKLITKTGFPMSDIGVYIQPCKQGIHAHLEFNLHLTPDDQTQENLIKNFMIDAVDQVISAGAYFSRPYDILTNKVFSNYQDVVPVLRKVKDLFDPRNVMNPGKLCFTERI